MFVALGPQDRSWSKINSTKGASKLVSFGECPALVPGRLVEEIKNYCEKNGQLLTIDQLKVGNNFTLTSGPFSDFVVTVEKIDAEKRT